VLLTLKGCSAGCEAASGQAGAPAGYNPGADSQRPVCLIQSFMLAALQPLQVWVKATHRPHLIACLARAVLPTVVSETGPSDGLSQIEQCALDELRLQRDTIHYWLTSDIRQAWNVLCLTLSDSPGCEHSTSMHV
jgi:hypothetical protein